MNHITTAAAQILEAQDKKVAKSDNCTRSSLVSLLVLDDVKDLWAVGHARGEPRTVGRDGEFVNVAP